MYKRELEDTSVGKICPRFHDPLGGGIPVYGSHTANGSIFGDRRRGSNSLNLTVPPRSVSRERDDKKKDFTRGKSEEPRRRETSNSLDLREKLTKSSAAKANKPKSPERRQKLPTTKTPKSPERKQKPVISPIKRPTESDNDEDKQYTRKEESPRKDPIVTCGVCEKEISMNLKDHIELEHRHMKWDEYLRAEEERKKMKNKPEQDHFEFWCKFCHYYKKKEVKLELDIQTINKHLKEVHNVLWKEYRETCHKHGTDDQKWGWMEDETIDLHNSREHEEAQARDDSHEEAEDIQDDQAVEPPQNKKKGKQTKPKKFYAVVNGREGSKGKIFREWSLSLIHI